MLEGCGCVFVLIPDGKPEYALHMNVGIYAIMAAMGMFNTDGYPEVFKFRRWAWITYLDKIDRITMLDNKQSLVEFYRCLSPNAYFEELLTDFCWYCREFKESLRKWTEIFVKQDVEIWIS